ncbi:MAG: RAMP superfamily CRISPR-associated protein [Polyangiales bacterium]
MISVHRLAMELRFPAGVGLGETRDRNALRLARDGKGRLVLRGTSLAGALRHAYARRLGKASSDPEVVRFFGGERPAQGRDDGTLELVPSRVRFPDVLLRAGDEPEAKRTHIARDRHTGAVLEGALFEAAATSPGTAATVVIWVHDARPDAAGFVRTLPGLLHGLTLGGSAARGIGRVEVESAWLRAFDLDELDDHAAMLDEARSAREGKPLRGGETLAVDGSTSDRLVVRVAFRVPRGQDVLVADGVGFDFEAEPQQVTDSSGKVVWRLPGSTLRGALRSWVSRLAAREGHEVIDAVGRHLERLGRGEAVDGDDLAYGFVPGGPERDAWADDPERIPCPVMRLFGSGYAKGRLHVADAFAPIQGKPQVRRHVAVDRITGGAQEGLLFDNTVVPVKTTFESTLTVERPTADEARWIAQTLRAIDVGLIRIGSSKAAGRLAVASAEATGPHAEAFVGLGKQGEKR